MKSKTGWILGIIIICVALLLLLGAKGVENMKAKKAQQQEQARQEQLLLEQQQRAEAEAAQKAAEEEAARKAAEEEARLQAEANKVIKETTVISTDNVMSIPESELNSLESTHKNVITVISDKRLLMVDEDSDSKAPKILSCCFDLLCPDNTKITFFVNKTVYDSFNIGDRLVVDYTEYVNDNGIAFPLINSVDVVQSTEATPETP